jgi:hypothetical protein
VVSPIVSEAALSRVEKKFMIYYFTISDSMRSSICSQLG